MLKRFFSESFRAKKNRPMSFVINWLGLTIGFTAVIIMYLYIVGEMRHDHCFARPMDDVYRLDLDYGGTTPIPLAELVRQYCPEVESATYVFRRHNRTVGTDKENGERVNYKMGMLFADSALLSVMPYKMIAGGSRSDDLATPDKVMLSRAAAVKLFGDIDAVGRPVVLNNNFYATVTAVFEDPGPNNIYSPEVIASMEYSMQEDASQTNKWYRWIGSTYIKLFPGTDAAESLDKIADQIYRHSWAEGFNKDNMPVYIRPFNDLYFSVDIPHGNGKSADRNKLTVLGIIAALILVIAIVNYINIYTARSTEVIRSMGIKRAMGANRAGLVGFVIADSVLIVLLSVFTAFELAGAIKPLASSLIGTQISTRLSWDMILVLFAAFPLGCGILSGLLPAITLTRVKPIDSMSKRPGGVRMSGLRNALIVVQFSP